MNEEKDKLNIWNNKKDIRGALERAKRKAIDSVDQNDDGKLDFSDAIVIASNVGAAAENAITSLKETADISKRQMAERRAQLRNEKEYKELAPLFEDELSNPGFFLSKLIRITSMDKRHAESELCRGSIGFRTESKDMTIINIYRDNLDLFGLSFYPNSDGEIYYVDPVDRNRYIDMNEYFIHLKEVRVAELQRIAQDLGAKHFKVTYREEKKSLTNKKGIAGAVAKIPEKVDVKISAESERLNTETDRVEIAAEMKCVGHEPIRPELKYFQNDLSIQNLVELRMSKNPIVQQKYTLHCSNTVGIKEMDAIKIDAALAGMKCSGNTRVTSEAQSEGRRFFEYEIDF